MHDAETIFGGFRHLELFIVFVGFHNLLEERLICSWSQLGGFIKHVEDA